MPPVKRPFKDPVEFINSFSDSSTDNELPSKMALLDITDKTSSPGPSTSTMDITDVVSTPPMRMLRNRCVVTINSQKNNRKCFKRRCYTTPRRRYSTDSLDSSSDNNNLNNNHPSATMDDMLCMFRSSSSSTVASSSTSSSSVGVTRKRLETIHEEPHLYKGSLSYLGPLKVRRILFSGINKTKTKRRKAKIKKITNKKTKIKKIPLDEFIKKLHSLEHNTQDHNIILS